MMTVKGLSDLIGISVRALHYYEEIGLFIPAEKSEAGYRFYDEKSLENLIQIVFFREFGIPLKKIKDIINSADYEGRNSLPMQRKALVARKKYMECLISSLDSILNGITVETDSIFLNKTKMNEAFQAVYIKLPENIKQIIR